MDLKEIQVALNVNKGEKEYRPDDGTVFWSGAGILDVFPLTEENPIRMSWGDEIDTIRYFDRENANPLKIS